MNTVWPEAALSEIARPISRPVAVIPGTAYRTIGVKWWGEGAYERETIDGAQTAAKTLSLVCEDDVIINKIWVRHGSAAVASKAVDGCSASGEFPTFELDRTRVLPRWLHWQTKTRDFWTKCDLLSRGTSGKNRIRPDLFLTIRIPLPPLAEQRRLVARIEALAARIAEARGLRREASDESDNFLASESGGLFDKIQTQFQPKPLGSFNPHVTSGPRNWGVRYTDNGLRFYRAQDIGPDGRIKDQSKVFIDPPETQQGSSARLQCGDLTIVITGATVGRCAVYSGEFEQGFISQHVALCRLPDSEVDPQFALWGLRSPMGQTQLLGQRYGQGKPGLNLNNIRSVQLPFPPLAEQRRIVTYLESLQAKVDALKQLQAETAAELDKLLPAVLDKAFKAEL